METVCFCFGHKKKREGKRGEKKLQVDQNAFEALHNVFKPPCMEAEQIAVFKWYFYQRIFFYLFRLHKRLFLLKVLTCGSQM